MEGISGFWMFGIFFGVLVCRFCFARGCVEDVRMGQRFCGI